MKLDASLETRTNKEGKSYQCIVIKLSDKSEKLVFLNQAETELVQLHYGKNSNSLFNDMPDLR